MSNFLPIALNLSELEPVDVLYSQFENARESPYILHIILVVSQEVDSVDNLPTIYGGACCEFYKASNTGLLTYIAVNQQSKKSGLGRRMVSEVLSALNIESKLAGHPAGCAAIYLETNNDNVDSSKDVMPPVVRRKVLFSLGFRFLKFSYVQPALSADLEKCKDLYLGVHHSFLEEKNGKHALRSKMLLAFMRDFFITLQGEKSLTADEDYLTIERYLKANDFIEIYDESI